MTTIDTATLIELWPIVPAIGSVLTALYVIAKKAWKNDDTMADLVKTVTGGRDHPELGLVSMMTVLTARVDKLTTQLNPFITLLNDSVSRMILGGSKTNPLDMVKLRKIQLGLASTEDIAVVDASIAKELEAQGPEAIALSNVRIWLALKKAEKEDAAI